MDSGFIKIHRQINGSELSAKPIEWKWIWIQILLDVNYEDNGIYKRGKMITKYKDFAERCGARGTQVRKCVEWLRGESMIETRQLTRGVEISVINWEKYQSQSESIVKAKGKQSESTVNAINKERRKEEKKQGYVVITVNHDEVYMQAGHLSITHDEFTKLSKEFGPEKSDELVQSVLNYRKNTSYKSLYLTAIKWGRREKKKLEEPTKKVKVDQIYET